MAARLVLHIGDHKTGSTSIQHALARGLVSAPGLRIAYPTAGAAHSGLAKALGANGAEPDLARADAIFATVRERLEAAPFDVAILSSELFESVDPALALAALRRHLPEFAETMQVVAYVRPHPDSVLSRFCERSKIGSYSGLPIAFLKKMGKSPRYRYAERFGRWRALVGERLILRPMVRGALYGDDAVRDFLRTALGTEAFTLAPMPVQNASLGLEDLVAVRFLQGLNRAAKVPMGPRADFGRAVATRLLAMPGPRRTKVRAGKPFVRTAKKLFGADAAAVDAAYFADRPLGRAFAEAKSGAERQPQSFAPEDHWPPETLDAMAAWHGKVAAALADGPSAQSLALHAAEAARTIRGGVLQPLGQS